MNVIGGNTETNRVPVYVTSYTYKVTTASVSIYVYDNINGRKNAALYGGAVIVPVKGSTGDAVIESAGSSENPTFLISNIQAKTDIVFVSGGGAGA